MIGARTVLVVEPSDDDRGGLADTLRHAGTSVESASDGARALAAIEAKPHAVVLVDPATPGLDAEMLVESLRGIAQRPVVLVMIDHVAPRRGFGADVIHGYVRRGSDGEELAELIRDCLAALCGTGSQPVVSPEVSLRLPQ